VSSAHDTVKAMLDDPLVLALVLHEIGERGGADELGMKMAYWQQADPFLWTLVSLSGDMLGEVSLKGQGEYETTVYAGEYVADGLSAGPFGTLDEAKASVLTYLDSENEVGEVFDECPWG
jgi:hypothetical protein